MEAVKRGGDRQKLHEIIRRCSMEATEQMRNGGECDLLARLEKEPELGMTRAELEEKLSPKKYTGRCARQVSDFLKLIAPMLSGVSISKTELDL